MVIWGESWQGKGEEGLDLGGREFWVRRKRRRKGGGNEGLADAGRARIRAEGGGADRRGLSECRVCEWMEEGARARRSRI